MICRLSCEKQSTSTHHSTAFLQSEESCTSTLMMVSFLSEHFPFSIPSFSSPFYQGLNLLAWLWHHYLLVTTKNTREEKSIPHQKIRVGTRPSRRGASLPASLLMSVCKPTMNSYLMFIYCIRDTKSPILATCLKPWLPHRLPPFISS